MNRAQTERILNAIVKASELEHRLDNASIQGANYDYTSICMATDIRQALMEVVIGVVTGIDQ